MPAIEIGVYGTITQYCSSDYLKPVKYFTVCSRFLKTNAYKSIGRSALWKAMPAYTDHGLENKKLENVIESWLLNDGMPEVIVR